MADKDVTIAALMVERDTLREERDRLMESRTDAWRYSDEREAEADVWIKKARAAEARAEAAEERLARTYDMYEFTEKARGAAEAHAEALKEALREKEVRSVAVRLADAATIGTIFDHSREALEAALDEFQRCEEHHRWHHEQEGREVEPDGERLRVLMVISEALDELPEPLDEEVGKQTDQLRASADSIARATRSGGDER